MVTVRLIRFYNQVVESGDETGGLEVIQQDTRDTNELTGFPCGLSGTSFYLNTKGGKGVWS